jgi:hypothetical protein
MKRYVLEGEWSGHVSQQQRIVHREVTTQQRAERIAKIFSIVFTDGTKLYLSARPAQYREKVKLINGYPSLIREVEHLGISNVHVDGLRKRTVS